MIDPELKNEIDALSAKIDAVYTSSEKMRKYFFWTMIVSVVVVVLPLLGLVFAVPSFISTYTSTLNGAGY
jgi:hypothetical protein